MVSLSMKGEKKKNTHINTLLCMSMEKQKLYTCINGNKLPVTKRRLIGQLKLGKREREKKNK